MSIFGALLGGGGSGIVGTAAKSVTGGGINWGSLAGTAAKSAGGSWFSNLFGGGGGSSGGSSIWQGLLGGLGAAAQGYMDEKAVREAGKQQRQTIGYTAELEDFYRQKDKSRKRAALDTYGQFSLMSRYAPRANRVVPLDQPVKPSAG